MTHKFGQKYEDYLANDPKHQTMLRLKAAYPSMLEKCDFYLPIGWTKLVETLLKDLTFVCPEIQVAQVKEKFGGLRFYADNCNKEANELIKLAEQQSVLICEECGKPGELRSDGWLKTLCDEHYETWRKRHDGN